MPGEILVVDGVSTNRILLRTKLTTAGYSVRLCGSPIAAQSAIADFKPDLILLDCANQDEAALSLCKTLRADPATADLPIIATGGFALPADRVAALRSGADDVLTRPFNDLILQARIRAMMRNRAAAEEVKLREDTRQALGFSEARETFSQPQPVTLISPDPMLAERLQIDRFCTPARPQLTCSPAQLIAGIKWEVPPVIYIIDGTAQVADLEFYRLLSEIRSHSVSRHAALLVLVPPDQQKRAAMALDLGADDLAPIDVIPEEIGLRIAALLRRQRKAELLRATVKSGLEAAVTDR